MKPPSTKGRPTGDPGAVILLVLVNQAQAHQINFRRKRLDLMDTAAMQLAHWSLTGSLPR